MKPAVHRKLTETAIALCGERFSPQMRSFADEITCGSVYEDNYTLDRLLNWHFYRSADSTIPKRRYLFVRPTSEHVLHRHIRKMLRCAADDRERYEQLGRVLHHIQDMSTPSHVLAIYHDLATEDYFESFVEAHMDAITGDAALLPDRPHSDGGLAGIYHRAAERTRRSIAQGTFEAIQYGVPQQLPLNRFWHDFHEDEDPERRGFGMFGDLHACFDPKKNAQACPFDIAEEVLLGIQKTFCKTAIEDSALALLYVDDLTSRSS